MIITKTPLRMSFLGGGTDYPEHFLKYGGQTLAAAMNKYTYITVKYLPELFDYNIRVSYSRVELKKQLDEIEHPSARECLRYMGISSGVEVSMVSDLPARTGVGSSSSFTVGFLHALHSFQGRFVPKRRLAEEAVYVEQQMIREQVGVQDQYTCALGGLAHIQCETDGTIKVAPVTMRRERREELGRRLLLFYTGLQRNSADVLREQMDRTTKGELTADLRSISGLVDQGLAVLYGEYPLSNFGELLHTAWMTKRSLSSQVTTEGIDRYYQLARKAGAIGGKLMGAGAGGFLLLYVEPEYQSDVRAALGMLHEVKVGFDYEGTSVTFCLPEDGEPYVTRSLGHMTESVDG